MSLTIKDREKVHLILRTFSQLDQMRWKDLGNDGLINCCSEDLTPDEKLLTHYLCYIMDRGMPILGLVVEVAARINR